MSRVLSAVVLVALVLSVLWHLPPIATVVLVAVAAMVAASEVAGIAAAVGASVPRGFVSASTAIAALATAAAAWPQAGGDTLVAVMAGLVIAAGAVTLSVSRPEPATVAKAAVLTLTPVYVGIPLGLLAWFRVTSGPELVTWLLAIIAVSDSAQYYSGRTFGRTPLAPSVSPKKTVEGLVGGLVVVAVVGFITGPWVRPQSSGAVMAVVALGLAFVGVIGDLFESLLKRSAGVKDSSTLIPGHGGVLDRIDSHLFAAPAYYLLSRWL